MRLTLPTSIGGERSSNELEDIMGSQLHAARELLSAGNSYNVNCGSG